ncbi:MAG: hypothetical protein AB9879_08530 [Methanothrix sp.]
MNGQYDFLLPLSHLMEAYRKHLRLIWILNAVILSIAAYAVVELLGLPAFMHFYWQDYLIISALPALFCIALGLLAAKIISRRKRPDFFTLLGGQLSEQAKTAYDNRNIDSLPMQNLARDMKASLSRIKPAQILNQKQITKRAVAAGLLLCITIFIAQSQISADITPADFQSLADLRDKVLGAPDEEKTQQSAGTNLTGNLYGKPSLAVLSENKLDLTLYPGIGAGSIARNTQPIERTFQQSQGGEAAAVSSELYIESLPPQNKEIIKKYFTLLSAGSG